MPQTCQISANLGLHTVPTRLEDGSIDVLDIARVALFGLTAIVVFGGATWIGAWSSAQHLAVPRGRIAPNRTLPGLALLVALGCAVSAVLALFAGTAGAEAVVIAFCGPLLAVIFALPLCSGFDISWDERAVAGPSTSWFWPFAWDGDEIYGPKIRGFFPIGPPRTVLLYDDIAFVRQTWLGGWIIEDARGNRIRWSLLYPCHIELIVQLRLMCPGLFDDD